MVRGPEIPFDLRELARDDADLLQAFPAFVANLRPGPSVTFAVAVDILGQCVQREMRCGEGKVVKERLPGMLLGMVLQAPDGMLGNRVGGVVTRTTFNGSKPLVVLVMNLRAEESPLVAKIVRVIEPALQRHAVDVPFARVVRAVPGWREHDWQQLCPARPLTSTTGSNPLGEAGDAVATYLLSVITGQQCRSSRPAPGGVVELSESQAVTGQSIQVRCLDLAAVTAQVREPKIIGQDQQHVGSLFRRLQRHGPRPRNHVAEQDDQQTVTHSISPVVHDAIVPSPR